MSDWLNSFFALGNIIFSSAIIIVAFSLFLYLFTNNFRNSVARSFSGLLAFLTIIYVGDVFLQRVGMDSQSSLTDAAVWLKFKWIGIAFIPAAYLHFSDALLRATNAYSRWRRVAVIISYLISGVFLMLVAMTSLVVRDGFYFRQATQFEAGPLFLAVRNFLFRVDPLGLLQYSPGAQALSHFDDTSPYDVSCDCVLCAGVGRVSVSHHRQFPR